MVKIDLLKASFELKNRHICPTDTNKEIGSIGKKLYMIDFNYDKLHRITWGLYKFLRDSWAFKRQLRSFSNRLEKEL